MVQLNWLTLLKENGRDVHSKRPSDKFVESNDFRNSFKKDFDQIVSWSSFRRLQDKAQVFPLEEGDFSRTRLTHSTEVMSTAESLGEHLVDVIIEYEYKKLKRKRTSYHKSPFLYPYQWINEDLYNAIQNIPMILRSAALLHDLGNPPFGHVSEGTISKWFEDNGKRYVVVENDGGFELKKASEQPPTKNILFLENAVTRPYYKDFKNFDGNAETLRIIRKLQNLSPNTFKQHIKISYPTIASIIKYPDDYIKVIGLKHGPNYFRSEKDFYKSIQNILGTNGYRHPLAFLLEAADDISYYASDLEDAMQKNLIDIEDLLQLIMFKDPEKNTLIKKFLTTDEITEIKKLYNKDDLKNVVASIKEYINVESKNVAIKKSCSRIRGYFISRVKKEISNNYIKMMNCTYYGNLLENSDAEFLRRLLKILFTKFIYYSDDIVKKKALGIRSINTLLDNLIPSIINSYNKKPTDDYSFVVSKMVSKNFYDLCMKRIEGIKSTPKILYELIFLAIDYISGMTDTYAENIANNLR